MAAATGISGFAGGELAPGPRLAGGNDSLCLTCHGDANLSTTLSNGSTLSLYVDPRTLRDSAHAQLGCLSCHTELGAHPPEPAPSSAVAERPAAAVTMCLHCHVAAAGDYGASVHGVPVLSGTGDGATCNDCHSSSGSGHATSRLVSLQSGRYAESVAENCGRCHRDALATYRLTAHSQLARFSDNRPAATCTNCHGAHGVSAAASGALAPARMTAVCQNCHRDANEQFTSSWLGHATSASLSGVADGVHRSIVVLMAVCVGFGVTHVTLDFLRNPRRPGGGPK